MSPPADISKSAAPSDNFADLKQLHEPHFGQYLFVPLLWTTINFVLYV
jgi:hypothetical protein